MVLRIKGPRGVINYNPIDVSESQFTAPQSENDAQYIRRNIAKFPATAYQTARTGFGLGDIANQIWNSKTAQTVSEALMGTPQERAQTKEAFDTLVEKNIPSWLPSTKKRLLAQGKTPEEISKTLDFFSQPQAEKESRLVASLFTNNPDYYTQQRPEDWKANAALGALTSAGVGGVASGLKGVASGLLGSGGALLGSAVGSRAGEYAGQVINDPELGSTLGGLAGGLAGGVAGSRIPEMYQRFKDRPSQALLPKAQALEEEAIAQAERNVGQKQEAIKGLKEQRREYDVKGQMLDEERYPLYQKARELEQGAVGKTDKLQIAIDRANKVKGLSPTQRRIFNNQLMDLETDVRSGRMSLANAKGYKEVLNDVIYDPKTKNVLKKPLSEVRNALRDFIYESGSPEHTAVYKQAEATHGQMKQMLKKRGPVRAEIGDEISILREGIQTEKQAIQAAKEQISTLKQIAGGNDIDPLNLAAAAKMIGSALNVPTKLMVLGGGIYKGIKSLGNEKALLSHINKFYPQLAQEYAALANNMPRMNPAQIAAQVNLLGDKVQRIAKEDEFGKTPKKATDYSGLKIKKSF